MPQKPKGRSRSRSGPAKKGAKVGAFIRVKKGKDYVAAHIVEIKGSGAKPIRAKVIGSDRAFSLTHSNCDIISADEATSLVGCGRTAAYFAVGDRVEIRLRPDQQSPLYGVVKKIDLANSKVNVAYLLGGVCITRDRDPCQLEHTELAVEDCSGG